MKLWWTSEQNRKSMHSEKDRYLNCSIPKKELEVKFGESETVEKIGLSKQLLVKTNISPNFA